MRHCADTTVGAEDGEERAAEDSMGVLMCSLSSPSWVERKEERGCTRGYAEDSL